MIVPVACLIQILANSYKMSFVDLLRQFVGLVKICCVWKDNHHRKKLNIIESMFYVAVLVKLVF